MVSFKLLETFLENTTLNLIVKKTSTGIVVSVLPIANVDDKAKENLIPLIIKGTAEELDQEFMQLIQPELASVTGIITNVAEFEAHAKEMKDKSEAEKKAKESKKKANETSKKALEGADKLLAEEKYDECQKAIDKALENNDEYKPAITLQNKLNKAKPEDNQVDIFNVIEEVGANPIIEKTQEELVKTGEPQKIDEANTLVQTSQGPALATTETISLEKQEKVIANIQEEEEIVQQVQSKEPIKSEQPKGPNVIINKVPLEPALPPVQDEPQETVTLSEIQDKVISEIKEKKEEAINQQTISNEKPTRADFESTESYDNRLKMWEENQKIQQGLDEINEIADASPNIEVVSLPPQTPKPIEPNNGFENEVKATSNNPFEPTNPEQELWEAKGYDRGNNNETVNFG